VSISAEPRGLPPGAPNGRAPARLVAIVPPSDDSTEGLAGIAARFTRVDWRSAWDEQPAETDWLIEPVIEAGQSVALYAVPGTGKSLLALEGAAALATGRPVFGNPPREPVTVVYIDAENRVLSLVERLQAFGYKPADLDRLVLYSFPALTALDSMFGGQQALSLAVTSGAALVVIDTTSRVVGGPENDADTYLAFYRHTVVPLRARGIALLRLDHPGKNISRGARGSSAKRGDVDAEWLLTKTAETMFMLERQKSRDNHGEARLVLRRRFEPLRHDIANTPTADRISELVGHLDRLSLPLGTGRITAARVLRDAGIRVRNDDLAAAIRCRKPVPRAGDEEN
jgi:hypothetical protein